MASATIYAAKKRSVQYRPRKLREQNSHFAREMPTCRECTSENSLHYVDVNNFAICNNSGFRFVAHSRSPFLATGSMLKRQKKLHRIGIGIEIGEYFLILSNNI